MLWLAPVAVATVVLFGVVAYRLGRRLDDGETSRSVTLSLAWVIGGVILLTLVAWLVGWLESPGCIGGPCD
jgi:hypothetical protein